MGSETKFLAMQLGQAHRRLAHFDLAHGQPAHWHSYVLSYCSKFIKKKKILKIHFWFCNHKKIFLVLCSSRKSEGNFTDIGR